VIVDAHVHVFRRAALDGRAPDALVPAEREAPVEQLVELMDAHGVDRAVLVPLDEHDEYVASALGGRFVQPDQLPALLELPAAFPELPIVLNHLGFFPHDMRVDAHGRPAFDDPLPREHVEAVLSLARFETVHVMLSGQYALSGQEPPYRDLDPVIGALADAYGADRMLWASDHPWIDDVPGYGAMLALPSQALPGASPAELEAIRGGTALRLFPRLSGGT
jgi:predicted TIM-barrel fold metal-dependent hydrolase